MTTTVGRSERQEAPDQERPLRIVLVEFLPSGGMFQFSFQFATALAQAGHSVTLLTGPDPELSSRVDGLQIRSLLPTWHPNAGSGRSRPPPATPGRSRLPPAGVLAPRPRPSTPGTARRSSVR